MNEDPKVERMLKRMNEYFNTFNERFPLYLESDPIKVVYYINECILEKKTLEQLFPEEFGDIPEDRFI